MRAGVIKLLPKLFGADCYWVSNPPSVYGASGRPDIELIPSDGVFRQRFVGVEFKSGRYGDNPISGLSAEQRITLQRIAKAGGFSIVANQTPRHTEDGLVWKFWVVQPDGSCVQGSYSVNSTDQWLETYRN